MAIPSETTVRRVLGARDRWQHIHSAIDQAWGTVFSKYPDSAWFRRKTTQASLIWEYAVQNAVESLDGDSGVQIINRNDTVSFVFDELVLVRFKKADLELRTRNYPTQTALLFHEHELDLFGFSGVQRVEAAYVPNQFQSQIDWIGIVARDRDSLIWCFELDRTDNVVTIVPSHEVSTPASKRVVRLKEEKEKTSNIRIIHSEDEPK